MVLVIISLLIFVVYLIFSLRYIGHVPASLSETFYLIGKARHCFTAMMFSIAVTLLPAMLNITPESRQFLAFLALSAICFVGAAPNFKDEFEGKVHKTSAVIAAVCGLLWVVFATDAWPMIILSVFCASMAAFRTNTARTSRVFWLEMIAFGSVYLSAIIQAL